MGDIPENEQAWERLARAKNYRCSACNQLIPFSKRETYFESGLCGLCYHNIHKDD